MPQCNLHDWISLQSKLLFAYDQPVAAGNEIYSGVRNREFSAWLVRSGEVRLVSEGEEEEAGPGEWIICFGHEVEQHLSPRTHLLSLRILQGWPDGTPLFNGRVIYRFKASKYSAVEQSARRLLRTVKRAAINQSGKNPSDIFLWKPQLDYLSYLRHERCLSDFLTVLARVLIREGASMHVPAGNDARLASAIRLIDSMPPSGVFPARDVSRAAGLSEDRINRLCVKTYGFTLHAYWDQRRFEIAEKALAHPGRRIKETASELGFATLPHFSAWFRRHAGVSPREYRQRVLGQVAL